MDTILRIAYQGGTHGNFLRYCLDRFSRLTPEIKELPFTNLGTSHNPIEYSGAFKQANSPSELKSMLRAAIDCRGENKKDVSQDVLNNMLNRQVGNSDGKSAHRFIDVVESASSR